MANERVGRREGQREGRGKGGRVLRSQMDVSANPKPLPFRDTVHLGICLLQALGCLNDQQSLHVVLPATGRRQGSPPTARDYLMEDNASQQFECILDAST